LSFLPTLNATLNAVCFALLVAAYIAIRRRKVAVHRRLMLAAVTTSVLFLVSYLTYHASEGSRPFPGTGIARTAYLVLLTSHVILAAAIVPMVLVTLRRGLKADYASHRRIARRTLPLWMYVSVTGVIVYLALYVAY
jgi:putative membrane protein